MSPGVPESVTIEYDRDRAARQRVVLSVFMVLMLAVASGGVWMILFSHQQYPGRPEAWIGTGFGAIFVVLGLAVAGEAGLVLERIGRLRAPGQVLVFADAAGVTLGGHLPVPWSDVERIEVLAQAPPRRGASQAFATTTEATVSAGTYRILDRLVGLPSGLRDGSRAVWIVPVTGAKQSIDLTLPVGPEGFTAYVSELHSLATRMRVSVTEVSRP